MTVWMQGCRAALRGPRRGWIMAGGGRVGFLFLGAGIGCRRPPQRKAAAAAPARRRSCGGRVSSLSLLIAFEVACLYRTPTAVLQQ